MQESLHNKQGVSLTVGMRTAVREALSIATQTRYRSALRHQVQRLKKGTYSVQNDQIYRYIATGGKKLRLLRMDVGGRRIIRKTVFYPSLFLSKRNVKSRSEA
jgi:hypothetical protein